MWRDEFDALIRERMRMPFAWGTHDCCIFAADCVAARIGVDLAAGLRGTYSDALGAARELRRLGGLEEVGAMSGNEIKPLCATAGDIGMVWDGAADLLAVCSGEVWLVPARSGLAALPFNAAKKAWRPACRKPL